MVLSFYVQIYLIYGACYLYMKPSSSKPMETSMTDEDALSPACPPDAMPIMLTLAYGMPSLHLTHDIARALASSMSTNAIMLELTSF